MSVTKSFFVSVCLLILSAGAFAQDDKAKSTDSGSWSSGAGDSEPIKKKIEPGVWVYGRTHRFAEVGEINSFDTSPDGKTMAFGVSRGVKLFDLEKNKIVDEIKLGENEQIAGFVYVGSASEKQDDRDRPALGDVVQYWGS